jgi:DNA segregation ATPase FtsK/SpoIIIE, S-DNA-T family
LAVRRKKPVSRWRSCAFFLFLFASLASAVALVAPPPGFLSIFRDTVTGFLGLLSVFIPLFLFLSGARILDLKFAPGMLRAASASFLSAFFFVSMASLVMGRISPGLLLLPGGILSARTVLALQGLIGAVPGWIALFSLFMASIVVFTGWDISTDINGLLARSAHRRKERKEKRPPSEPSMESPWTRTASAASETVREPVQTVPAHTEPAAVPLITSRTPVEAAGPFIKEKNNPAGPQAPPVVPSREVVADHSPYTLPETDFLTEGSDDEENRSQSPEDTRQMAVQLIEGLSEFGVECSLADHCTGPVLTRFEIIPASGVKVNRIINLADDLAMRLEAKSIRILAPIPGKGAVGIEIPNRKIRTVYLSEVMGNISGQKIPVALGTRLDGVPFVADLTTMPHLLIAGATGSGKSVCVHAIISTILLTRTPYQVRLAMVDPKMLELSAYAGIPHLWSPVVTQHEKAKLLLEALVKEMEERYGLLARNAVRSIGEYNRLFPAHQPQEHLPYIVVVIDELADLMMVSARDVEPFIARLAQMARAVGIHLVVATQRPSVDVITGVIKANFPSRIAFNVQSKTDSRTILDMNGADKLLGQGDMLYVPAASPEAIRIHGSFISTAETKRLVEYWSRQEKMDYEFDANKAETGNLSEPGELDFDDPLLEKVKDFVIRNQTASISIIQRNFKVGYPRAGKLIDMLARMGVIGPHVGSKAREVLVQREQEEQ